MRRAPSGGKTVRSPDAGEAPVGVGPKEVQRFCLRRSRPIACWHSRFVRH